MPRIVKPRATTVATSPPDTKVSNEVIISSLVAENLKLQQQLKEAEAEEVEEAYAANAAPEAAYSDMAADTARDAAGAYEDPDIAAWFAETAKKIGGGIMELLSAASR